MPGEQEPPPYEVLAALVASLRRELAEMAGALAQARTELAGARERIAGLEARLNQNPRNSPGRRRVKDWPGQRRSRGRCASRAAARPAGRTGTRGVALTQAARPNREIGHEPACCGRCGTGLADRPVTAVERRQVSGLQPVISSSPATAAGVPVSPRPPLCRGERAGQDAVDTTDRAGLHRVGSR
jgi:hypothetical protein